MLTTITVYRKTITKEGKSFPAYFTKKLDGTYGNIRFVQGAKDTVAAIKEFPRTISFDPENAFIGTHKKDDQIYTDLCISAFDDVCRFSDTAAVLEWLGSDGETVAVTAPAGSDGSDALPF